MAVSPPRVEGVGGLALEPLVLISMTDRCCGTRSARIWGDQLYPLGGLVMSCIGDAGWEREARA